MNVKVLVSACLMGERARYDGAVVRIHPRLQEWKDKGLIIPFCPEVEGGLPVPRIPAEISGGDGHAVLNHCANVIRRDGKDVSANFIEGAQMTLKLVISLGLSMAVLKDGSPSCGSSYIYDGTFSKNRIQGKGVTAAILEQNGIAVYSEKQIDSLTIY